MSRPIRVLLVDDQALFREGLGALLARRAEVEVVGEAGDGREALALVARANADVALIDLQMPELDGVATIRALAGREGSPRTVALTTFDDEDLILDALRAGAVGYLLKDSPLDDLIQAIRSAAAGETFLQPSVATKVVAELVRRGPPPTPPAGSLPNLSERELEVLRELAAGASNRQIAARLELAEGTVKNLVSAILEKLDVPDRTNAALRAREAGLA